jgi:hypothetical protein
MTVAVVWSEDGCLWSAADTRVSTGRVSDTAQVLTDHGPKILLLPVVVHQPGSHGFFDKVCLATNIGFAFAGSVSPALATHALCSAALQSLTSFPSAPLPTFEEIVDFIRRSAERYMQEWSVLSPNGARFAALIFGWCPKENGPRVFNIQPTVEGPFKVLATQADVSDPIAIGSGSKGFHDNLRTLRRDGEPYGRRSRLPLLAIESMITAKARPDVGGAIQLARASPAGTNLYSRCSPIIPGKPEARMTFLGVDIRDLGTIGPCAVGMTAVA